MNNKHTLGVVVAAIALMGQGCPLVFGFGGPVEEPPSLDLTTEVPPEGGWPTYTQREQPPKDQRTQKTNSIQCPGAEVVAPDKGGTVVNFVKLKDGKCYWAAQFTVMEAHEGRCDGWHMHGSVAISLDGSTATDPLPGEESCGFGKVNTVEEGLLSIGQEQFDRVYGKL